MESPRRTIRIPADREAAIRAYVQRTPGATITDVLLEGAMEKINRELAPEAFVVDLIHRWESLTIHAEGDDIVEVTPGEPRKEVLGRRLGTPLPLEQFVRVEARPEGAGRTVIELVARPGEFEGVRVYVATVPSGADVRLTVQLQDLYPAARSE
jgi:hypothetical protein